MCGILCFLKHAEDVDGEFEDLYNQFKNNIARRGPDSLETHKNHQGNYSSTFTASVLWLQGSEITRQPVENENSIFLYNGDILNIENNQEDGDTKIFLNLLEGLDNDVSSLEINCGPFAFVYLDKRTSKLYFARDRYGRRSLLIGERNGSFLITSVGVKNDCNFIELPPIGLYVLDLVSESFAVMPWSTRHKNFNEKLLSVEKCLGTEVSISSTGHQVARKFNDTENMLGNVTENLIGNDTENLLDDDTESLRGSRNVAKNFMKPPENLTANLEGGCTNIFTEPTEDDLKLYKTVKDLDAISAFDTLLNDNNFFNRVNKLIALLGNSVHRRVSAQPKYCNNCIVCKKTCDHCKVGILFSGGLDCTILALLADKYVDKKACIDLMNVAFETPDGFDTPDRLSGLSSLEELKSLCPKRDWNILEINVTRKELDEQRDARIKHLIYPLNTIMDDGLGCALWFAGRCECVDYKSPCRVLLVGMGADELFGGYQRHRTALHRSGWCGLQDCLDEEWQNISHRNLARDDRVVSDHGRQLRTPYLDENVVTYVHSLRVWERTCPTGTLAQGFGEKILLRSVGYKLGLRNAALLKKRALQFGSRIANKKEKAHEVSPRL